MLDVMVQHIRSKLYVAADGSWVKRGGKAAVTFSNAVEAISFCIQRRIRSVRLVSNAGSDGNERYLYPFGEDPVVKAERKQLRRQLAEHRRLNQQRRLLLARIDVLGAEAKERKKQVPFERRKKIASEE